MSNEKLAAFANEKHLNLMTFKKDGTGVPTPVWFVETGGTIYVYTLADAWKVKRVRNNPKVRIAPCDMRGKLKGEWVDAQARLVAESAETKRAHDLLDKKYGWMKKIGNLFSRFRKRERAVIAIHV
jgi:PPOX class probable F420-dependent enzyme